jgi:hypothetical protein
MEVRVIVCGDSFCSADTTHERWHFSQLLHDRYDMIVTNLARGGMSNLGICFQIKQAIELRPDVIIYNQADPSRVDLVTKSPPVNYTLKDFIYPYPWDESHHSSYVGGSDATVFSTVYQDLENQKHVAVSAEQILAVKHYHTYLFDWRLKFTADSWWFGYWKDQIQKSNILPIDLTSRAHPLDQQHPVGKIMYDFVFANPGWPKLYHTDRQTQEIVAEQLAEQIQKYLSKS